MSLAAITQSEVRYYPSESAWTADADDVRLLATRCAHCAQLSFPPTPDCWRCGGTAEGELDTVPLAQHGVLYSYTEIHVAPGGFTTPYVVGTVDFPEGIRVLAQVAEPIAALRPGTVMRPALGVIRRDGDVDVVSYVFRCAA